MKTTDMSTSVPPTADEDRELKDRHRRMWSLGDYPRVAREIVAPLGPVLVDALGIEPGERVLDVAAGTGNAAVPAARRGAHVVASDLTPALIDAGRTETTGITLEWEVADAEALPYEDGGFDVVMSCIGVMFAPHHQRAADEMARTCRPGGRVGILSWTPEGTIGQLFATLRPYVPAPPAGVSPPPLWGSEDHVRELFGDRLRDITVRRGMLPVTLFEDGTAFRDYFATHYGPTIAAYANQGGDPDRVAALDRDLAALGDREGARAGSGFTMQWEYLLTTGSVA